MPKVYLAVMAVVLAALVIGVSNVGLSTYNLVAGVAGQAKLTAYIQGPVAPQGWSAQYETTFGWAKPLFGDTSVWNRYTHAVRRKRPPSHQCPRGRRRHQHPRSLQLLRFRR